MIRFADVCYAYEGEPVLRHINFTIAKGDTVLLRGPNGAGKSTLLRMLNGLIYPELGTYQFLGTEITAGRMRDHRYSKWFHQQVGFVWQNPDAQLFCGSVAEEHILVDGGTIHLAVEAAAVKGRVGIEAGHAAGIVAGGTAGDNGSVNVKVIVDVPDQADAEPPRG
jgi:energy-coupling factor transporter ATP-binding protein EcfA2